MTFKTLLLTAATATVVVSLPLAATADNHKEGNMAAMESAKAHITKAVKGNKYRTDAEIERDQFRNPIETLMFFGITPDMTLVEVGPGGGWYTSILAPLVADDGKYIAVANAPQAGTDERSQKRYTQMMNWRETWTEDDKFGDNASARFVGQSVPFAAPGSVDAALIFRGMHGPLAYGDPEALLGELFTTMKPGGVLGIVQHRAKESADFDPRKTMKGYVKQSYIIDLVEKAGFKLESKSEINANEKDPTDWEKGVWTLQAGKPIAEKDKKFQKIGESDRMTLKFVKPMEDVKDGR